MNRNALRVVKNIKAGTTVLLGVLFLSACCLLLASCDKEAPAPPAQPGTQQPPRDFSAMVRLYRPHLEIKSTTGVPPLEGGILRPVLQVEMVNKGPLAITHLKFVARISVPAAGYATEAVIEPFAVPENRGKALPPGSGLKFQVPMEPKKIDNPAAVQKILEGGGSKYAVSLAEIAFLKAPQTPKEWLALYAPHLRMEGQLEKPEIKDGSITPMLRVGLSNLGPFKISHLKFQAKVTLGDVYEAEAVIAPFALPQNQGKHLPSGKPFIFTLQFDTKKVEDLEKAKKVLADEKQLKYNISLVEIGFTQ
jgi:hypothetical protein